jgi:hypothetical protein
VPDFNAPKAGASEARIDSAQVNDRAQRNDDPAPTTGYRGVA